MVIELIQQHPKISIIVLAAAVSLVTSIVNFFFLDKERMREIKSRQKTLQAEMKEHQKAGNQDKMMELNKELMSSTGEMFKHSSKPILITFIPIIIFFGFIKSTFLETSIASTWFWWYLGGAIVSSMIFRKLFRLP